LFEDVICGWLRKAKRDLKWAERMLAEEDFDYSSFHSQQAAEKALKSLIIAKGQHPPRTHNIGALLSALEKMGEDTGDVEQAKILTDYAVEARYPDFEEEISREEAVEALELARKVVGWARERLEALGVRC